MNPTRLKVAYLASHLPSYFAQEYGVFSRSLADLEHCAKAMDFDLHVVANPVVSAQDALQARREMEAAGVDLVLLQNSTFAMGDVVTQFANSPLKLGLWAVPEPTQEGGVLLNNFVSLNLNASILRRYYPEPIPYKWFYGYLGHPWLAPRLEVTVKALSVLKRLSQTRIGLVGGIAPTFFNFVYDPRKLAQRLGIQVETHELVELFEPQHPAREVAEVVRMMRAYARDRVEVADPDMQKSAAVFLSMRGLAHRHGYDALAISDWPQFQSVLQIHPGMAFSWLDEVEGIPVASEGDVLGAASMLLLRAISGQGAMLLDFTDLDPSLEAILAWHCGGSPLNLADEQGVTWKNHSTLGRKSPGAVPMGAVADFVFRPQPVTLTRIAAEAEQLLIAEAQIIPGRSRGFDGSRGWISGFQINHQALSLADMVNTVMVEGLEHHFILGAGRHAEILSEVAAWTGMKPVQPVPYRNFLQHQGA